MRLFVSNRQAQAIYHRAKLDFLEWLPYRCYMIAALFVEAGGCYFGTPWAIDPWDEARDARTYAGPHPVVAHSPCQRWGKSWMGSASYVARTGIRKIKGDDGGCFAHALASVRRWGGVLEHPRDSYAWTHFKLNKPPRSGGWVKADEHGGWTCCVEQGRYGHYARKPTWLYAAHCDLPELEWGQGPARLPPEAIERYGLQRATKMGEMSFKGGGRGAPGHNKSDYQRIYTPAPFRDLLLIIAATAKPIIFPWEGLDTV